MCCASGTVVGGTMHSYGVRCARRCALCCDTVTLSGARSPHVLIVALGGLSVPCSMHLYVIARASVASEKNRALLIYIRKMNATLLEL